MHYDSLQIVRFWLVEVNFIYYIFISCGGSYLTTPGSDAQICIWSTSKGSLLQTISCTMSRPIMDIIWATNKHNDLALIFSCADGSIHLYVRALNKASSWDFKHVKMIHAHGSHVESLDFDPINRMLASIRKGKVKLWKVDSDWAVTLVLTEVPRGFIARSVHFFNEGNSIMVTYLKLHRMWGNVLKWLTVGFDISSSRLAWNIYPWSFMWEHPTFSRV
ncbi:hypothetical protein K439DRAFT_1355866 [Ramaria rubella]|nr:hypothetical protein K439DRAFT_1355866 [Ramaria rubella]